MLQRKCRKKPRASAKILPQTHTPQKSGSISFRKIRILLIRPKDLSSFRFSGAARQMPQGAYKHSMTTEPVLHGLPAQCLANEGST